MSCPSPSHAAYGDEVRLGVCLGHPLEPADRWARLAGVRHHEEGVGRYVLRLYQDHDGAWPTGRYVTTWMLVPHMIWEDQ